MISIIIPVYNVELYLKNCIDSILRQSNTDYEVILIDDGSTDSSGNICDSYQTNKNFKVFHQSNQGVSTARNKGLDNATGEYILFVDPDDWLADNALEILLQKVGDADLVMFSFYEVRETINHEISLGTISFVNECHKQKKVHDPYYEILGESGVMWNKFVRRSIIGDVRFHKNMSYGEDMVFLAEILPNVKDAKIIPDILYYYFINRVGNVLSAPIDARSSEFLINSKTLFEICSNENHSAIGIQRISFSIANVLTKIPLTLQEIKNNRKYIKECKSLLTIPSRSDYLQFFLDKKISFVAKRTTIYMFLGEIYIYLRIIKHKLIR